jgi:septal ring factor EnvC (AmiA/AmiB activator)
MIDNMPPSIGTRFIVATLAIAAVVTLFFVMQFRVLPNSGTIESLNSELTRVKAANTQLNSKLEKLEVRLSSVEKELADIRQHGGRSQ